MRKGEDKLVFRPELAWPADKASRPFFTVPAWWRRFMFQVLTPREVTIYHYYLSMMNPVGVAFPTVDQILEDLGLSDGDPIKKAQKRLVALGFLVKPSDQERRAFSLGERPIYQRPCTQYTIRELLRETIDGELYPTLNKVRTTLKSISDSVVEAGIRHMLSESYDVYKKAFDMQDAGRDERLRQVLAQLLDEALERLAKDAADTKAEAAKKTFALEDLQSASEAVRKLFGMPRGGVPKRGAASVKRKPLKRRAKKR
jgi:hypothetical protein